VHRRDDLEAIHRLFELMQIERNWAGVLLRDEDYWRRWVPAALPHGLWVAERAGSVVAYCAVSVRRGEARLAEVGWGRGEETAVRAAVRRAWEALPSTSGIQMRALAATVEGLLPVRSGAEDLGWMYAACGGESGPRDALRTAGDEGRHLVWYSDAF